MSGKMKPLSMLLTYHLSQSIICVHIRWYHVLMVFNDQNSTNMFFLYGGHLEIQDGGRHMKIVIISSIIDPHNVGIATEIYFLWHILRKILTKLMSICIMVAILNPRWRPKIIPEKKTPGPRPHLLSQDSTCKPQDNYFRFKAIVLSISLQKS